MVNYRDILKTYWGFDDFRDLQEDIIRSVCQGVDTLALLPTGGGKSITFQVPSLAMDGLCLVITPLVALMKDQVENLKKKGIRAAAIYSGMTRQEIILTLDNCHYGDFKFLYISPERLATDLFRERVTGMQINLIAVDEAHCISQWGYDFRPAYRTIADIRAILPDVPVLALTATATATVIEDIKRQLQFKEGAVFRKSFYRKNLAYVVRQTEDKDKELNHILSKTPGSAIVYTSSRKKALETAAMLKKNGFTADYFHAGLSNESKDSRQQAWKSDACRIMVSTNAFGMGIDKPDVRLVVHLDAPNSIEAYFQEAGRAGRDGQKAYAVLLYHKSDKTRLKKQLSDQFPSKETIRKVYESLAYYFELAVGTGMGALFAFDLIDFCTRFRLNQTQTYHALKILEQAGYLELTDELDNPSRVYFLSHRDELYQFKTEDALSDQLLQVLLRSYTGLFSDFIPIQEALLAKRLGITADEVYHRLIGFSKTGVIHYIPRKQTPYIIYTVHREETDRLNIPKACYEDRKQRAQTRTEAILDYVSNNRVCRNKQLLAYFDERSADNCGQCDVCLSKTDTGLSRFQFEHIKALLITKLTQDKSCLHEELIDSVAARCTFKAASTPVSDSEKVVAVLRVLCDEGVIRYNPASSSFSLPD